MKQFVRYVFLVLLIVSGFLANATENVPIKRSETSRLANAAKPFSQNAKKNALRNLKTNRAISISLTKTDETCTSNGTINATVSGAPQGATVTYKLTRDGAPNSLITTTMPVSGLVADTYHVTAYVTTEAEGNAKVEEATATTTLINTYKPILASSTVASAPCATGTGKITVNVTQGVSGNKYVITSAPAAYNQTLPYQQSSNVFDNMPAGTYQIQVYNTCNEYVTITATVDVLPRYLSVYPLIEYQSCNSILVRYGFSAIGNQSVKYPFTIKTDLYDSNNVLVGTQTTVFQGTTVPGANPTLTHAVTLTNALPSLPLRINAKLTDACGDVVNGQWTKTNELSLKAICPPSSGFKWDMTAFARPRSNDRRPVMLYPITISYEKVGGGGAGSVVEADDWLGTVTGLEPNQQYNVTITDACGRTVTGQVNSTGSGTGQKAFVNVYPACGPGNWVPQFGTENIPGNRRIDNIRVIESPYTSGNWAPGYTFAGDNNLYSFTAGQIREGRYVFSITMGCDVDVITVNAVGGGIRLTDAILTPTVSTCNASNVDIKYSWLQGGADVPVPSIYSSNGFSFRLRDVSLPAGADNPIPYQASTLFTDIPNGTYDVIMFVNRSPSTQCDNVIGKVTINNNGPKISPPFGYRCKANAASTPFNVNINAVGTGALQYAISAKNGEDISPVVFQASSEFNNLSEGVYTILVKDNCATANTTFSTYSISNPNIRKSGLCPGNASSLIVNAVPGYTYQWSKNGVPLVDGGNLTGTQTFELKFATFTVPADAGNYSVKITYKNCVDEIYDIEIKDESPNAGTDVATTLCYSRPVVGINLDNLLSATAQPNGVWTEVNTTGKLNGNIFDPTGIDPTIGPFQFKYTVNGFCNLVDDAIIAISFNQTVAPTGAATQEFCNKAGVTYTLADILTTGTAIKWYPDATSTTALPLTTTLTNGQAYYATQTVAGCESFDRLMVTPTFKDCATDVAITKTDNKTTFTPGQPVIYTVIVKNNGPIDALDVMVTDALPAGITAEQMSWSGNGATGTGALNNTITNLANGAEMVYTVTVNVPSSFTGDLVNTATVASTTADSDPANNTATDTNTQLSSADIAITKTDNKTIFTPGQAVVYTVTVTNNGPSNADNIVVTDALPAGITASQMSWSGNGATGTGVLNNTIANLANGAEMVYTVTVNVPSGFSGNLVNTAIATSPTPDANPDNNTATDTNTPLLAADIAITKTDNKTTFTPGQPVVYTVTVINNGPSNAANVVVTDALPAGITAAQMSWSGNGAIGTGALNNTIASLANGTEMVYTVTVNPSAAFAGNLINIATVTLPAGITDPNPANNTATDTNSPTPIADIAISKTDNKTMFTPGLPVVYTVTVTNNGPSNAANVVVTDALPAGITAAQMSWSGNGTTGTGALNNTITNLANGANIVYTVTVNVSSGFTGNLVNTATAALPAGSTDPNTGNNIATDTDTPDPLANLVTVKTLKDPTQTKYYPGDEVKYIVKVSNNGPSDAKTVNIIDNAPTGTSIKSWSATGIGVTPSNARGSGNINETISNMPNGAVLTYEVSVLTPPNYTATFRNLVAVTSTTPDPTPDVISNPDPTCPTCIPSPFVEPIFRIDLSITKKSETAPVGVGYEFKYTIQVKNNSLFVANGVVATDVLPSEISYVSNQTSAGTADYQSGSRTMNWNIGTLQPGATVTLTLTVKADKAGTVVNTITVKGNEVDPVLSNNTATDTKEVLDFKIPNVITPNGDGKNDTFRIGGLGLYPENTMVIFNRWGNEVFHSNGSYQDNWTGEGLNAGTYYYLLKVKDRSGNWQAFKGYITLLKNN